MGVMKKTRVHAKFDDLHRSHWETGERPSLPAGKTAGDFYPAYCEHQGLFRLLEESREEERNKWKRKRVNLKMKEISLEELIHIQYKDGLRNGGHPHHLYNP